MGWLSVIIYLVKTWPRQCPDQNILDFDLKRTGTDQCLTHGFCCSNNVLMRIEKTSTAISIWLSPKVVRLQEISREDVMNFSADALEIQNYLKVLHLSVTVFEVENQVLKRKRQVLASELWRTFKYQTNASLQFVNTRE